MRKLAVITVLVLSSFAASNVAPSKAELEAMYDKAFREFDGNNFSEALKQLDAIDARQPDLAESQNLRGVILMREGIYDKAEGALHEALRIDPKFWNARFNLAEIPFLKKDWAEARTRFQDLLTNNVNELQGDAGQLIQYKILLTYLLEGKDNMVDSILARFELSPDTPAVHYANAAIALQHKNSKEAKDWMAAAEKNFSPQLNKLFAESLYEVGWLEKQAGQTRAALEITSPAEKAAKTKAFARSRVEQAQQAAQQLDYTSARKFIDEADAADPNQPAILNLRGEILMEQKEFDLAEASLKKAAKLDPKMREVQYNLAQIPFKKKEYAKARDRFEMLFSQTAGGDKTQAAQIIKFKIFMTLLLEGKESRAQKMMEQFQFTGDTPALYYAQAAWEFKHNNPTKAQDWIASAKKIYSPALNGVFGDSFYDLGWMQSPALTGSPAPANVAAAVMSAQTESSPAIEPSPIPGTTVAGKGKETLAAALPAPTIAGMEATTSHAPESPAAAIQAPDLALNDTSIAAGTPSNPDEMPATAAPALSPTVETPVAKEAGAGSPAASEAPLGTQSGSAGANETAMAAASATPGTVLAPAHVRSEASGPTFGERLARFLPEQRTALVWALIIAAASLITWVAIPEIRRRLADMPVYRRPIPATGPSMDNADAPISAPKVTPGRFFGGPRQVSVQLKASEPNLRRSVRPATKPASVSPLARSFTAAPNGAPAAVVEPQIKFAPQPAAPLEPLKPLKSLEPLEPLAEVGFESVGPVVEQGGAFGAAETMQPKPAAFTPAPAEAFNPTPAEWNVPAPAAWNVPTPAERNVHFPVPWSAPAPADWNAPAFAPEPVAEIAPVAADEPITVTELVSEASSVYEEVQQPTVQSEAMPMPEVAASAFETELEPVWQGQPVPYETPVFEEPAPAPAFEQWAPQQLEIQPPVSEAPSSTDEIASLHEATEAPLFSPSFNPTEPSALQSTIPETMPDQTLMQNAPAVRNPTGGALQPTSAMQTAVQLTFSFEIASMQLTPSFKMGALQLRPTSKIVTMRLSPSQQPQPAMNLQVTFELSKIQPAGGGLGTVRLAPSQQQRPNVVGSPSFTVAGLQLVSNFESAPVQLTPSQQASVLVTGAFQIATVEFSPAFEIASIVLNSSAKQVAVQLPGGGPIEGAPRFEIANLQLGPSGDIGMMQLNLLGGSR
ncbi:MAG TPA: tetratricopeptide repeat protein [Chthoniobacterales bacterium]